ncbi:MAG: hypothetical protein HY696_00315 [Deltaproteobacteria bacterium]|nr:hypothetical protein [Deltaproteobacteria bacterium]
MMRTIGIKRTAVLVTALLIGVGLCYGGGAFGGGSAPTPQMPTHWKVISDHPAPAAEVKTIGLQLHAALRSVRNTIYEVNGRRVQLNVIVAADTGNAEKLLTTLKTMKTADSLLRKGGTVYEFVGPNDVLPLILEGRKHLEAIP